MKEFFGMGLIVLGLDLAHRKKATIRLGSKVTGNEDNDYGITNKHAVCRVIFLDKGNYKCRSDENVSYRKEEYTVRGSIQCTDMAVCLLSTKDYDHINNIGNCYWVRSDRFKLV